MSAGRLTWSPSLWDITSGELVRRAGRWWLREFLAFFPTGLADWLMDKGRKSLVLSAEDDGVDLELVSERRRPFASTRIDYAAFAPDVIDRFLRSHGLRRADVSIGVRLPAQCVFARKLLLPVETERMLDAVLVQDLLTKTPFRLDDIFHDQTTRRSGNRLCVWQWVVRRQYVIDATETLGLQPGEPAFVEAPQQEDGLWPRIRLHPTFADQTRWMRRAFALLVVSACVLAVVAIGLKYHRQQQVLDVLGAELSTMRAKAQRVRTALDKLESERAAHLRLRLQKRAPGLLDVWEEATRVLPSHSWLTELRLADLPGSQEQQIVITGLSPAAAALVGLIDRSPLFREAALTAPISIDPSEGKERFAIQARLKALDPLRTAAR